MTTIGYFLSSEEHTGPELVEGAVLAERAGFRTAAISDHFHPWLRAQGQSPFVWSVLGAIAQATRELEVVTGVVCPTMRVHPVIVAQATATVQQLFAGRFTFGIGSGEALNEHIAGDRWPAIEVRHEMLEEAMEIIRRLWTGDTVDHHGKHYTVENARLYTLPDASPRVVMSAFGPKAVALAARIADGYFGAWPAGPLVREYRARGGTGPAMGELKVCWHEDEDEAARTAHRTWRHELVSGQHSQDLPTTDHFEQLAAAVSEEAVRENVTCGPDPDRHAQAIQQYIDAGFDEVYVAQMGPDQAGMIEFYRRAILPRFEADSAQRSSAT
jgi:G6PDH family F420-dependent oxidoreductase